MLPRDRIRVLWFYLERYAKKKEGKGAINEKEEGVAKRQIRRKRESANRRKAGKAKREME